MEKILEKAKKFFFQMVNDFGSDPYNLLSHVPEVERWANYMCEKYPEADKEVVLLSVWLHDIGHYPVPTEVDHAVRGENRAKEFLKGENYNENKLQIVLHCVRSHRCSDIMPETIEAKIIAFIDSASHMTDNMYFGMCKVDEVEKIEFRAIGKIERDFRDLSYFPEIKDELKDLYLAWKNLIEQYQKLNFLKKS